MSEPRWTKEQKEVIDSRNGNLLVAAAAGSGKTAVLVERIIQMITDDENSVDINRLLVVTFTNAAATEMKERIQIAIEKLIQKSESNEQLKRQLALINDAKITTIHAFCLNVIENYYFKIPLDPDFKIGTEQECAVLKIQALEQVLDEYYEEGEKDFIELVKVYGTNRDDSSLKEIMLSLYNFIISSPNPEQWLDSTVDAFDITDNFDFLKTRYGQVLLENLSITLEGIEQSMESIIHQTHGIAELQSYYMRYVNEHAQVKTIRTSLSCDWDTIRNTFRNISYENYQKGMKRIPSNADEYIKKLKDTTKAIRDDCKDNLNKLYDNLFYRTEENIREEYRVLYPHVKIMSRILKDFISKYQLLKKHANLIDFNDIEHFALRILTSTDSEGNIISSDIAKEYSNMFDEIFIDEYQDSSLTQEIILKSISKDYNNRFMVGDVKQSIYKFRQARPDIFLEKYNSYTTESNKPGKKILLHKNFRSRKEILDATNFIFEHIMSTEIGGLEYDTSEKLNLGGTFKEPTQADISYGGPVEINLIQGDEKKYIEQDDEQIIDDDEEVDRIQTEARVIANIINDITTPNQKNTLHVIDKKTGEYREASYRDIVILLRSTTRWEEIITSELQAANIPVYSESTSEYFETFEVKSVLTILKAINNIQDDIALLGALRTPVFDFSIDEIVKIRSEYREDSIYDALIKYSKEYSNSNEALALKINTALKQFKAYREVFLNNSLEEALCNLYKHSKIYLFVRGLSNGEIRKRNLDLFLERARRYEETHERGLQSFLKYLDDLIKNKIDIPSATSSSSEDNSVKIMTIHKSKGLEFPVVICAGLGKKFNNLDLRNTILTHADLGVGPQIVDTDRKITYPSIAKESIKNKILIENLSEEMRVLYVALTRAKEKLYLVGTTNNLEKSLLKWSGFAKEEGKIPKYAILKSSSYLDWIIPATLKHPNLSGIRSEYKLDDIPLSIHESKWTIKLWNSANIDTTKKGVSSDTPKIKRSGVSFGEFITSIKESKAIMSTEQEIPNKLTVTETIRTPEKIKLIQPIFIKSSEKEVLTAAEKGIITHEFLQRLDFNKVDSKNEVYEQLKVFVEKGIFSKEEARYLPIDNIYNFFISELGTRVLNSKKIKREQEVSAYLSASKVFENVTQNTSDILVKGVIDLYFEEDDDIILIDYKTDNVQRKDFKVTVEEYKKQVYLYKEILEKITQKNVKEGYLYFFSSNDYVNVQF